MQMKQIDKESAGLAIYRSGDADVRRQSMPSLERRLGLDGTVLLGQRNGKLGAGKL